LNDGPGRSGAISHARYFLQLLNFGKSTGSVAALREASLGCDGCERYARSYEAVYGSGGRYDGSLWRATSTTAYPSDNEGYFVFLTISADAGWYWESAEAKRERYKPAKYKLRLAVARKAGAWKVTEMLDAS
jgi:hypothetical protein